MTLFAQMLDEALAEPVGAQAATASPCDPILTAFERALEGLRAEPLQPAPRVCAAAKELGVELPCSAQDIARAFRRLAFKTHPDRPGGSHDAFLRAQALFSEALAALNEQVAAATAPPSPAARFRMPAPLVARHSVYA
jgi:hypothetical protein